MQDSQGYTGSWGSGAGFERHARPALWDPEKRCKVPKLVVHEARCGGLTQYILLSRAVSEGLVNVSVRRGAGAAPPPPSLPPALLRAVERFGTPPVRVTLWSSSVLAGLAT